MTARSTFGASGKRASVFCALGAAVTCGLACEREERAAESTLPVPATAAPASTSATAPAPVGALDRCVVGQWKAKGATLTMTNIRGSGGANVLMDIQPSGATKLDFSPMQEIVATSNMVNMTYRYSGEATGTTKTTSPSTIEIENADYSAIRVSGTVAVPGGGKIPMFDKTPLSELTAMGAAIAGALGPGSKSKGGPQGRGIDSSPIFSAENYACSPATLKLWTNSPKREWLFGRVGG